MVVAPIDRSVDSNFKVAIVIKVAANIVEEALVFKVFMEVFDCTGEEVAFAMARNWVKLDFKVTAKVLRCYHRTISTKSHSHYFDFMALGVYQQILAEHFLFI